MISLNKSRIINLVRFYGPISRTELSKKMDISMAAITKYISELISENIITESGTQKTHGGRRPILLSMNPDYGCVICIDFGQSFFRIAVLSIDNKILYKQIVPSDKLGLPEDGLLLINGMIADVINKIPSSLKILAIGIAVSGITFDINGTRILMPNLKGWVDVDLETPIAKKFQIPVYIDDSSRMVALCESVVSAKGRIENLIYIHLGTGIGAGIIINGKILRGVNGTAGELGHIIVEEGGRMCGCGSRGCLEQYVSVPSMVNQAKKAILSGVRSNMLDYAEGDADRIDSYCLAKAVADKDKLAYNIVAEAGEYLGVGISKVINLFNPEHIIIGGGGVKISDMIMDDIKKVCHSRSIQEAVRHVDIKKSDKDENSALIGASVAAQDRIFDMDKIQEYALL